MSIRNLDICRASISKVHQIPHASRLLLADRSNALYPQTFQRYQKVLSRQYDRNQEGLWLILSSNAMNRTRVVRSWAKRRLQNAILSELRSKGFDGQGRRLKKVEVGMVDPARKAPSTHVKDGHSQKIGESNLIGSADVSVLEKIVGVKYETVQKQAGVVVQEILRVCSQSTGELPGGLYTTAKKRKSTSKGRLIMEANP